MTTVSSAETKDYHLPLVEKYRPTNLSEIISHDSKVQVLRELMKKREIPHLLFYGQPGTGKCLAKGTLVRMFDGTIKPVEQIQSDELLMGDDLTDRSVLSTCNGKDLMYKIEQSNGITYTVNQAHILTLKRTKNDKITYHANGQYYTVNWLDQDEAYTNYFYISSTNSSNANAEDSHEYDINDNTNSPLNRSPIDNIFSETQFEHRVSNTNEQQANAFNVYHTKKQAKTAALKFLKYIRKQTNYVPHKSIIDINVKDYISKSVDFQISFSGFRLASEQQTPSVLIDHYIMGLWLGYKSKALDEFNVDYSNHNSYIRNEAQHKKLNINSTVMKWLNFAIMKTTMYAFVLDIFDKYDVLNNTHIPNEYKYTDYQSTIKLLNGIIDGGKLKTKKNDDYPNFTFFKFETIANLKLLNDINEVCQMHGYNTEIRHKPTRDFIMSNIKSLFNNNIVEHHSLARQSSSLNITCIGYAEYYGFELDKNGRFQLCDGTVTHNTSLILALAQEIYGKNYRMYILELNASDNRGIDVVRQEIPRFAKVKTNDLKFVILDEADAMTNDAQAALRRIMEIYSKTCRFCIICNNINKIIPGIQSRCARMRFGVLNVENIKKRVEEIANNENIKIEPDALDQLLSYNTDFRQILNTLQCLKSICLNSVITINEVITYLGKPDKLTINNIVQSLSTDPFDKCYQKLVKLHRENRINQTDLIDSLVKLVIKYDNIDETARFNLIDSLAKVDYRITNSGDTEIQLASLVSAWIANRAKILSPSSTPMPSISSPSTSSPSNTT